MTESLRVQQKRVAHERIVNAAAEEVVASGLTAFSIAAVGERAGVSLRTVYNYFETKEALLDAIAAAYDTRFDELGGVNMETDLDRILEAIHTNYRVFGELGVIGEARARIVFDQARAAGHLSITAANTQLTAALRSALGDLGPGLDGANLDAVTAVVRHLCSFDTWHRLTHEFGLGTELAGTVTVWAAGLLFDALAAGQTPFDKS